MRNSYFFFVFISIVIAVYSLLNYYFIVRYRNIIPSAFIPAMLLRLLVATLVIAPIATIFFSYRGIHPWASITGFTGYSWLAFLFLFLVINGFADIALFIAGKFGFSANTVAKEVLIFTMSSSFLILLYGFVEASNIRLERLVIETTKSGMDRERIKIMQISDVHFSPTIGVEKALKIKDISDKEKPDILISTGDLLDRSIRNGNDVIDVMKSIRAPLGKFAITGNHEFITGIEESTSFIEKCGFTLIRNTYVLAGGINLVGVDDPTAYRYGAYTPVNEAAILRSSSNDLYTIFLKHQPRILDETIGLFDLQLSGHTHAGQIFPFSILVKLAFPNICGYYNLGKGSSLYVSRGTGTWGPPVRFLASPEITIIEIVRK